MKQIWESTTRPIQSSRYIMEIVISTATQWSLVRILYAGTIPTNLHEWSMSEFSTRVMMMVITMGIRMRLFILNLDFT